MKDSEKNERLLAGLTVEHQGAEAVVVFSGMWRMGDDRSGVADSLAALAAEGAKLRKVTLRDGGIQAWDSTLLTVVRALRGAFPPESGILVDIEGMPEGVRRLIRLAEAVPARREMHAPERSWLWRMGEVCLKCFEDAGASLQFLAGLGRAFWAMIRGRARYRKQELWVTMQECGPEALPILSLMTLLVGMILAFLGAVQLKMFGAEIFVADAVAIGMAREMGALMTGILMAGRTGAAFAARLGTMQVNEEVDALRTMGFDPMEFLVLPRALALIVMMPLLSLYAVALGILGGGMVGVFMLDLSVTQYLNETMQSLTLWGVCSGLIKSVAFGVVVAVSGCMQGIRCGRSAEAVGVATTTAVVNAIVYIVVTDSFISVLYTVMGW